MCSWRGFPTFGIEVEAVEGIFPSKVFRRWAVPWVRRCAYEGRVYGICWGGGNARPQVQPKGIKRNRQGTSTMSDASDGWWA